VPEPLKFIEYQTRTFDSSAFVRDGRIELNSEAQKKGGISLRWVDRELHLQAGGVIGVIPLNDDVIIEVRTRVPVARVEEIVRRSGSTTFVSLSADRGFVSSDQESLVVEDLIADRFRAVLEELSFEGIYKTYERKTERGTSPVGRILPGPTLLSLRTSTRPEAYFEHFVRTVDNDINRVLLVAGHVVMESLSNQRGPLRALASRLEMFDTVRRVPADWPWKIGTLPANRPVLMQAVELARLILLRRGVRFFGEGSVRLPSFLINMEDVFEDYVRAVLRSSPFLHSLDVLDGNDKPPRGAASEIFETAGSLGNHETKPDLVFRHEGGLICVGDVKYKPCLKQPDRNNLEQVLVYGLAYGAPKTLLVYPCAEGQETSVQFLGTVRGIDCFKATMQLMNENLDEEEAHFCELVGGLLIKT
jgi:5-methylcytosine-specific restriction enzyme subunit McrC